MSKYSKVRFGNGKYGIRVNGWLAWLVNGRKFVDLSPGHHHMLWKSTSRWFSECQSSKEEAQEVFMLINNEYTVIK